VESERLEDALGRSEGAAEASLRAAATATRAIKAVRAAAHVGNLRELRPAMQEAAKAVAALEAQLQRTIASWDVDEERYLREGAFVRELLEAARQLDVRIFERDERLFCYPALLRVQPTERTGLIDRQRTRRLRPSVLAAELADLQRRPPRFKSADFLESLFDAYRARRGRDGFDRGIAERLVDIYDLLTLLPGQQREYSRQEFARDVYLLDRSGETTTREGYTVSFPSSTGTRSARATITVVTEAGQEKSYYAIAFARSA
jgi:hypothetical protein